MNKQLNIKIRILLTGLATIFIFSILLWNHFNGGVPAHHILHQKELPAISNWWSGLLLPIITWILLGKIESRIDKQAQAESTNSQITKPHIIFITGLSIAILISISFENKYSLILENILFALLIISLIIPLFYSEFILAFILGMTFTFGTILPTGFILIIALIGYISYRFIRPLMLKLPGMLKKLAARNLNR